MKILKIIGKAFLTIGVTLLGLLILCIVAIFILEKGPSATARDIFVHSVNETSRMGFVSTMFLSKEEVDNIMNSESGMQELEPGKTNDTDMITVDEDEIRKETEPLTIESVSAGSFKGVLMTIRDPARIFCGTIPEFGHFDGMNIAEMIDTYNANGYSVVGGINGGDFIDNGANASATGQPLGAVISEGEVVFAEYGYDYVYHLVGFTNDNKFIMGNMTIDEALEKGMRDAIYCVHETGPFLVLDGEPLINDVPGGGTYGSGKNPRTVIGQKEDGSVLFLVVDGRKGSTLGATFEELALYMKELGAINAACMDGGTSAQMVYEGVIQNHPYSPTGPRRCPTGWLVRE